MFIHPLSNEEYDSFFANSVSDILSRHAPDGTVLYISSACRSVLGCQPSDLLGRSLSEFAHADDRTALECVWFDLARKTDHGSITWRIRHNDGHYVRVETNWQVIYQPDGAVEKLLCLTRDITERMRAEIALRESEERFRLLADHAPVLIWLADRVDNLTFFNQGWLAFTGRTLAQELGQGWLENIHPDDRSAGLRVYEDAFAAREPYTTEYRLRRFDGQYRWVMETGTPRFDASGDFLGFIGSCIDIHQRKEFEDAIQHLNLDLSRQAAQLQQAYQEKFGAIFNESLDIILLVDSHSGHILNVNRAVERLLDYESDALIGKHFSILFPPEAARAASAIEHEIRVKGSVIKTQQFRRAGGMVVPMDLTAAFIPWENDRVILITLRDVTDRQHAEEALEAAEMLNIQLENEKELNELKTRFISMVSHEYRNPADDHSDLHRDAPALQPPYERRPAQRTLRANPSVGRCDDRTARSGAAHQPI